MSKHFIQDPDFTRFGFLPLSYYLKHLAMNNELILDHIDGMAYYYKEETKEYIPLNDPTAVYHLRDYNNPHNVTKEQVGLGDVDNVKQAPLKDFNKHINDFNNPHRVTKEQIGLGNVNNVVPIPKSEFDDYNKLIEKYIEELKNLQESIEFFASDRYRLTINTDPEDAVVRVLYNKKWNKGKLHKLPDGTYKFEVEWGGDTTPEEEEDNTKPNKPNQPEKPKEEKKYKVIITFVLDNLPVNIASGITSIINRVIFYDKKTKQPVHTVGMEYSSTGYVNIETKLPKGEYSVDLIKDNDFGTMIRYRSENLTVQENDNNRVITMLHFNSGLGIYDLSYFDNHFVYHTPSQNGNYIIDNFLNIYSKDATNNVYHKDITRRIFTITENSSDTATDMMDRYTIVESLRGLDLSYKSSPNGFAAIDNTGNKILFQHPVSDMLYFLEWKTDTNKWVIRKSISAPVSGKTLRNSLIPQRKFTWLNEDTLLLYYGSFTINFTNMTVDYNNHINVRCISDNRRYAISDVNIFGFTNSSTGSTHNGDSQIILATYNESSKRYVNDSTLYPFPDEYLRKKTKTNHMEISNDGNEIVIVINNHLYYGIKQGSKFKWADPILLNPFFVMNNSIKSVIKYVSADFESKRVILVYPTAGIKGTEYSKINADPIEIYSFHNGKLNREKFSFPMDSFFISDPRNDSLGINFANLVKINNIGWSTSVQCNRSNSIPIIIFKSKYGWSLCENTEDRIPMMAFDKFLKDRGRR